jgi:hypothetical protein
MTPERLAEIKARHEACTKTSNFVEWNTLAHDDRGDLLEEMERLSNANIRLTTTSDCLRAENERLRMQLEPLKEERKVLRAENTRLNTLAEFRKAELTEQTRMRWKANETLMRYHRLVARWEKNQNKEIEKLRGDIDSYRAFYIQL